MGVPKFYRWISERYPCLSEVIADEKREQIPEFDNLYLDMNGIIHSCSHPNDDDVAFRIDDEQIFRDIFHYIDVLFGIIKPKKVFFMAVDGVAPRAKMNQQRARRFMSAKNAQEALRKAKSKGMEIPKEKTFDSNCITPGTQFMARLHEQLQYFVQMKISTDSCWQRLRIYLSGHNCPGEGEHKIMDFIRSERSRPDYDPNTRHCLYGGDADLIMLGMCLHEPHFALLREEVKFGRPRNRSVKHRTGVDGITFHLLHLSLLREYISWEFHSLKTKLPFEYNLESVIDDWVLMGFLVGNDFIPHLPHVHIHEDALPLLYATYIEVLPQLDGYINEAGVLNLKRFEIFLKNFAKTDRKNFIEQMDDEAYFASKRTANAFTCARPVGPACGPPANCDDDLQLFDLSDTENAERNCQKGAFDSDSDVSDECAEFAGPQILTATEALSDGYFGLDKESDDDELPAVPLDDENYDNDCDVAWTPSVNRAFKNHKRDYYSDKMKYSNISKEELREQAEGYVRAIQWNLHYYYHGCCSWSWFYPHHYAPYISDVSSFAEMEMNFELSQPFRPFEQLLAVLPAASADCLPLPFQELMCDPTSPIIDFYPKEFDTDLNGKKNDWEAVVLIPFVKEDRLLEAVASKEPLLNDEERLRNSHGPHLLFSYDPASSHFQKSSLPGHFPDIQGCTATVREIEMNEFRIARSRIVYGLLPGVKLDIVFPGFPTMKHIPHTAELHFADIRIFQQPSKKQSMILKITNRPEFEKDMLEIAFDLLGTEVHVNWPLLQKALVHELWTANQKYSKSSEEEIICDDLSKEEQEIYSGYVSIARRNEFERRGIDAGEQKGLALVRTARGLRKCFEGQRIVTKRIYTDAENVIPVSLSVLVQDAFEDSDAPYAIQDAFPVNAKVFISSAESKYYGFCGFIRENHLETKGTLTVSCSVPSTADVSFYDLMTNYDSYALKWYSAYEVARFVRTTVDVVSRITGCVYVSLDDSDAVLPRSDASSKVNIGLELKFSKRNQIVPDFTRRSSEGHWVYSSRALELIRIYKMKFPGVFRHLENLDDFRGYILIRQLFPEFKGQERDAIFEELKQFLRSVAPTDALEPAEGTFVDSKIVKEIEKRTQASLCSSSSMPTQNCKRLAVKPRAIFRAELCKGDIAPDPKAEFRLLDRVVCVKKLHTAPFGGFGTVIGLLNTGTEKKIDVLFDKPYFGGKIMRSSIASGARVPMSSLINLTHGKRIRKEIPMVERTVRPKMSQREPREVPRNAFVSGGYSYGGFQAPRPVAAFEAFSGNKAISAKVKSSYIARNEWAPKSPQKQPVVQWNSPFQVDDRPCFQDEEQPFPAVIYGVEITKTRGSIASEKSKPQARPSDGFLNSPVGFESLNTRGSFGNRPYRGNTNVRRSGGFSGNSGGVRQLLNEKMEATGNEFVESDNFNDSASSGTLVGEWPTECVSSRGGFRFQSPFTNFGRNAFGNSSLECFPLDGGKTWDGCKQQCSLGAVGYAQERFAAPSENVSQKRGGFAKRTAGSAADFGHAKYGDRGTISPFVTSDMATLRDNTEVKAANCKMHHGYPRAWFGSSKSPNHKECSEFFSQAGFLQQQQPNFGFPETLLAETKRTETLKKAQQPSFQLLRREVVSELPLPASALPMAVQPEEMQKTREELQERTAFQRNDQPISEIIQRLDEQKIGSEERSSGWAELPAVCLSSGPAAATTATNPSAIDVGSDSSSHWKQPGLLTDNEAEDSMTRSKFTKKPEEGMDFTQLQNPSIAVFAAKLTLNSAASVSDEGAPTNKPESRVSRACPPSTSSTKSTPSRSPDVLTKCRRLPRKSRVAANLWFNKEQK